ncbi:MAG: UDP-glucose--hexose-1-phosphate uridylyltransferase [Ectobacillus sp.]
MDIYQTIQQLIEKAISAELMERDDELYARNQILSLLHLDEFATGQSAANEKDIPDLMDELVEYACQQEIIEDIFDEREILGVKIMNVFISKPSEVNKTFYEKYKASPASATEYFYELSKNSNYIQMKRIQKNISYKVETEYGSLDITINLSKPEKDPRQIAKEKTKKSTNYPKCLLCAENEGYAGRIGHPARSNHRMIRMELTDESWFLQYSPYVYYNEHCIVLSAQHRDMKIDRQAFLRLLQFVERFPHYFLGSNADLPIVGGSILTHDHYQGGNYEFAMAKARDEYVFGMKKFSNIQCAIVKWPMSVLRLRGEEIGALVDAADYIAQKWKSYSDASVEIHAFTGETPHNTVTPIARKRNGMYELDLVLRNNRTSEEYPLGIFHPHDDVHHIKKENIGLIEVMGLAVLPARLKTELLEVEKYILNEPNSIADYHIPWAEELKEKYESEANKENIEQIVKEETGKKFLRVLEDAGVFKRDEEGKQAFKRFISTLI